MQKNKKTLSILLGLSIIASSCATVNHPRKYKFCQLISPSIAECSIDGMSAQRLPTTLMVDPGYVCMDYDDHKDFVLEFMENEMALKKCQTE